MILTLMQLYNTLTKQKETFTPLETGKVKLYTCGPTVYDYVHIGNLRSYVMADTLRRVLEADGLEVQHVKNITDVGHLTADDIAQGDSGEDKLIKALLGSLYVKCQNCGKLFFTKINVGGGGKININSPMPFACSYCGKQTFVKDTSEFIPLKIDQKIKKFIEFYTDYYHTTEAKLNIERASQEPHATEYVEEMIAFIESLIAKGHAYEKNGNVFFDVTSFKAYGALSGNTLDKLKVGARLEEHPDKKNPWDFALWLRAPEGHLMHWTSPWGEGYPGWHIECSAMNLATLGATIDIHTGGEDNIFPHHEAEIAQSECGNDAPFVRYWVHTRHLLVDGQKMSKSKGNFYRLEDILERGYSAMDLRMLYLGSHYRSQMNFTWDALAQARKNKKTIVNVVVRLQHYANTQNKEDRRGSEIEGEITEALHDDLNTPQALALILDLCRELNQALDTSELIDADRHIEFFKKIYQVFGLRDEEIILPEAVQKLLDERAKARAEKDFHRSDALRDEFLKHGFVVEDIPGGEQRVRRK